MDESILEMQNISKSFPGVRALEDVFLSVMPGTIHALVGENGAGKSTMMKILSGVHPYGQYEGKITIEGAEQRFKSISDSEKAGIAIIYQELANVKELSVCENFFIGQEISKNGIIDWDMEHRIVTEALKTVDMGSIDPDKKIKELGVGHQQLVEIAKALNKKVKLLILDEPTASLSEGEVQKLFTILRDMRRRKVTCIYISHRLDEIFEVADEVTVIRDGKIIGTRDVASINKNELIAMMVGRELTQMYPRRPHERGDVALEIKDWTAYAPDMPARPAVNNVSFKAYRGEILGIAGLIGSGRTELAMNIIGAWGIKTKGQIFIDGREANISNPREAIEAGISCLSENRKEQGLVLGMDIKENITAASSSQVSRYGVIDHDLEAKEARSFVEAMRIKCASLEQATRNLSGGNQQKVCLAKWMMTKPKVLILDEPTRGVDVGAKVEIYELMNNLVERGVCVIMISSELQEVLGISDRILVMGGSEIRADFDWRNATQEKILASSIGGRDE
jgi:ABC-type sugar transport system ATPase subunit